MYFLCTDGNYFYKQKLFPSAHVYSFVLFSYDSFVIFCFAVSLILLPKFITFVSSNNF
jgi:hypothetical protein